MSFNVPPSHVFGHSQQQNFITRGIPSSARQHRRTTLEDTNDEDDSSSRVDENTAPGEQRAAPKRLDSGWYPNKDPVDLYAKWDGKSRPSFWGLLFLNTLQMTEDMVARFGKEAVRNPAKFGNMLRKAESPFAYSLEHKKDASGKEKCLIAFELCMYAATEKEKAAQEATHSSIRQPAKKSKKGMQALRGSPTLCVPCPDAAFL